ncbi:hypothetical protein V6N13_060100 [Hibiscus sabdariffa]
MLQSGDSLRHVFKDWNWLTPRGHLTCVLLEDGWWVSFVSQVLQNIEDDIRRFLPSDIKRFSKENEPEEGGNGNT